MRIAIVAFVTAVLFSTFSAHAQSQSEYMHQPHISARVMGMGGAFTALADDYQALYYNPAGLARLQSNQFVADISVGATPSILGFSSDLSSAGSDPTKLQNVLDKNLGDHFASRVGLGGTLVHPGWGFGMQPLDLTVEADITGAGPAVGVVAYQDTTLQYGRAWNIDEKKNWSVGIAPKVVYRGYVNKALTVFDLITNNQLFRPQDASEGVTVDADLGMLYSVPIPEDGFFKWIKYAKPTFGLAVRNVVDEGFFGSFHLYSPQTSTNPVDLGRRIDVGSSWELPSFWVFTPHFLFDEHDIGYEYYTFTKGLHTGLELQWKAFSWLQGAYSVGISEGYLTAGINAELGIFMLDLVTYSEEIGTSNAPEESRRWMAQLSLDF